MVTTCGKLSLRAIWNIGSLYVELYVEHEDAWVAKNGETDKRVDTYHDTGRGLTTNMQSMLLFSFGLDFNYATDSNVMRSLSVCYRQRVS